MASPPKKGDLFDAMIDQNSADALMFTCNHLRAGTLSIMEADWIAMSALIGKRHVLPFGGLWSNINKEIVEVLESDDVSVVNAILCTTKLMLLYKRCIASSGIHIMHISTLRTRVVAHFPENGTLSNSGLSKYNIIMPITEASQESVDTLMFCHRILAGFSKLFAEEKLDDIRLSLEYISKKKIPIVMNTVWPCPDEEEAQRGDLCWFLWGMLGCYYGRDLISNNLKLFIWEWKRSLRNDRIGLLWGIAHILNTNVTSEWTYQEKTIIERVTDSAEELWKQSNMHNNNSEYEEEEYTHTTTTSSRSKKSTKKGKVVDTSSTTDVDQRLGILFSFIPRIETTIQSSSPYRSHVHVEEARAINVLNKKEMRRETSSLYEDQDTPKVRPFESPPPKTATDLLVSQYDSSILRYRY
jgi:hypothetical protein